MRLTTALSGEVAYMFTFATSPWELDREAWHAAIHGAQRGGHDWVTELNWCCSLGFQNSPQTRWWEGFLVFCNFSSFTSPSPGWVSVPNSFVSLFNLLFFVLPPFEDNGLPFWEPGVLCQCSEVVLWKLFNIQTIFWWFCGGESGLPVLFLCHLGTAPLCFSLSDLLHSV